MSDTPLITKIKDSDNPDEIGHYLVGTPVGMKSLRLPTETQAKRAAEVVKRMIEAEARIREMEGALRDCMGWLPTHRSELARDEYENAYRLIATPDSEPAEGTDLQWARTSDGRIFVGYNPRSEEGGFHVVSWAPDWINLGAITQRLDDTAPDSEPAEGEGVSECCGNPESESCFGCPYWPQHRYALEAFDMIMDAMRQVYGAGNDLPPEHYLDDEIKAVLRALSAGVPKAINVVFDGPPGPTAGRFVEVETDDGKSVRAGEWIERDDGLWALRIDRALAQSEQGRDRLQQAEARIRQLEAALHQIALGSLTEGERITIACKALTTPPPDSEPAEGGDDPYTLTIDDLPGGAGEAAHRDQFTPPQRRDALEALEDIISAAVEDKGYIVDHEAEVIRRALSTGVPEAFRRTIAFAQEECQEPSVMHVSDMARLIRDYAQAELDRALPQPQEGESDG